jgi:hypothetical protein
METSKMADFISTYCDIPSEPKSSFVQVTEEEVIDNFTSYIKNTCVDEHNLVKYKMSNEFYGKIDKNEFWRIIIDFITREMGFDNFNLGEWKPELVYNSDYSSLGYKEYFLVTEKKYDTNYDTNYVTNYVTNYDTNYVEDYIALEIDKIDKIVFRIYKK